MVIQCSKCSVRLTVSAKGAFLLNSESCSELIGTRHRNEPQWCPVLSDSAPESIILLPSGYRDVIEAEIAAAKKTRGAS